MTGTHSSPASPTIALADGTTIPQLGYGVYLISDDDVTGAAAYALDAGYRHIDTAAIYDNEAGVGRALRASTVPRDDIHVTTKLWNSDHRSARAACEASLARLGLDQIDLYLIHWPAPRTNGEAYRHAWQELVTLRDDQLVRSIGVSNFCAEHLRAVIDDTGVVPVVNQVELHPYFQQRELRSLHSELGVRTQSWSPLAQGGELLGDATIATLAAAHSVTPAQVILRWHVQHDLIVIPKSENPERMRTNADIFSFALTSDEMAQLDALDQGEDGRIGPDPMTASF